MRSVSLCVNRTGAAVDIDIGTVATGCAIAAECETGKDTDADTATAIAATAANALGENGTGIRAGRCEVAGIFDRNGIAVASSSARATERHKAAADAA